MSYGVIFDIDGTLFDTGEGIKSCVRHAVKEVGMPPVDEAKLDLFIGPSLFHSFTVTAGFSEQTAEAAIEAYRKIYSQEGIFLSSPYCGVSEMIEILASEKYVLSVASSKPLVMVEKLLEHSGLRKYFARVCAPDYARRGSDKAKLVRAACADENIVMVGDTHFDIDGAHGAGIKALGVTYGYGKVETLFAADALARSPKEIPALVKKLLAI